MSVGTYTYGTVAGVTRKVGWVIAGHGNFSASTIPTTTDVELILDEVATEIHAKLADAGYALDTAAAVLASAPRASAWLAGLNECGAAARVLMGFAIASDPETGADHPEAYWKKRFEEGLKLIASKALRLFGMTKSEELSDLLVCTSVLDEDGNEKEPLFKRDMWNNPGTGPQASDDRYESGGWDE